MIILEWFKEATGVEKFDGLISSLQLLATCLGGLFAVLLLRQSNKEKKLSFISNIFERLYDDESIVKVLYAADKDEGLEEIKQKVLLHIESKVELEMEVDKTLRYLDYVGSLVKGKYLSAKDLTPFKYEICVVLNNEDIMGYWEHLNTIKITFNNLDYLKVQLCEESGNQQP